jgi:DHA2 family multidrug resistance protein
MLILARIVQGAGGGALQPISQAVLLEAFPAEKRGSGMSVYTLGVVVAPILGPTLGGWMTDNLSWRWVFYINVPIGILSAAMCFLFLEDPPYLKDTKPGRIDYIGFSLLTLWIGCLQVMLDKGQDADWFSSTFIRVLATGAALGFIVFVFWELKTPNPIVNLRVLLDRNLAIGAALIFMVGAILNGTTAILPQFMQNLMNYTALQAGLVISPRGLGAIAGSLLAGYILSKVDGRAFMAQGAALLALSMYWIGDINLFYCTRQLALADHPQRLCRRGYFCAHYDLLGGHRVSPANGGCDRLDQPAAKPGRFGGNLLAHQPDHSRHSGPPGLNGRPPDPL